MSEQPQDLYELRAKTEDELIDFLRSIPAASNREKRSMIIAVHTEMVSRGTQMIPVINAELIKGFSTPDQAFVIGAVINVLAEMKGLVADTSLLLESLLDYAQLDVQSEDEVLQYGFDVRVSGERDLYKESQVEAYEIIKKDSISIIAFCGHSSRIRAIACFCSCRFLTKHSR